VRRLKEKIFFALLALATPAAAHVPPLELAPAVDLRHQATAQELVQPFPVFAGTTAFEDVTRIELPPPSLAAELAHRFAAGDVRSRSDLAIFERTVSRKLASGPLAAFEENNVKGVSQLGLKLHRAIEFQALPFTDPATGLVYARARWYDPSTGSFLSPDPMGFQDSSNLYAFCAGDPVNCSDPTGEFGWSDVKAHASVTWGALKGVGKSVGKLIVGSAETSAMMLGIPTPSAPTPIHAQVQLYRSLVGARNAVAQWGTSAGTAIGEPQMIAEALNELSPDEIGEEVFDAVITTSAIVAPAAKARVPAASAPRVKAPRVNPRHTAQVVSVEELDAVITKLGERAVRHGDRARTGGMSGVDAGNYAEATYGRYLEALNKRLIVNQSPYIVEWQPAMLPGYGRVPPFIQFTNGQIYPFPGSLRLDAGLSNTSQLVSTPAISVDVYPSILRGYDITLDAGKVSAVSKYQTQFGVPIRDIRPK